MAPCYQSPFIHRARHHDYLLNLQQMPCLPAGCLLVTLDVSPSTQIYSTVKALWYVRRLSEGEQGTPTQGLFILTRNAFTFSGEYYLQLQYMYVLGTAMGTRMTPSYANLFADDIFAVWTHGEPALDRFKHESIS